MRFRFLAPAALLVTASALSAQNDGSAAASEPVSVTTEPIAINPAMPTTSSLPPDTVKSALEVYGWIVGMQTNLLWGFSEEESADIVRGLLRARDPDAAPPPSFEGLLPIAQSIVRERRALLDQAEEAKAAEQAAGLSGENTAFFAQLATQEGIMRSDTGLYYQILDEGVGRVPTEDDTVRLHYHGTLITGDVFDSSRDRGEPTEFPVRGVIPGFSEGVRKVREGGKIKFFVPPELGYGNRQAGRIPPGSILIFEVELLEVIVP